LVYAWDLDNDGAFDDASGMTTEWIFPDNGAFTVGLKVTDSEELSDTDTVEIEVLNAVPQITLITAPIAPVQVRENVAVWASFIDLGAEDTHTALINWGDGITSDGVVSGYLVTASHAYIIPGVYTLTLTVTDDDSGSSTEYYTQYVVVFDPDGGFVTGGGWFRDSVTSDKANFGFNAKYNMDVKMPFGNTNLKVDDLQFKSTSYDWLVIYGAKAQYKGKGTINGTGEYEFSVTAIDGANTGNGVDYFRIRIWDKATGILIYDNDPALPDNADPTVSLGGGSIVIQK
jgi:PKD repeat protein